MKLRLRDVISHQGNDHLVEGLLTYRLGATTLTLARTTSGDSVTWVEPLTDDMDDRILMFRQLAPGDLTVNLAASTPPPTTIVYKGQTYVPRLSGVGTVTAVGNVADRSAGECAVWRYRASGDVFLQIEKWPDRQVILAGASVHKAMVEVSNTPGAPAHKLVLLRHGESDWNRENRFTGWTDVDLSDKGRQEAKAAGQLLKKEGFTFDVAFSSLLKRAVRTLNMVLDEMDQLWLPVSRSWRLNERHYGALQGLNKAETAAKFGDDQVKVWRRSYDVPPPPLEMSDPRFPGFDPRYKGLAATELPVTECLKDTVARFLPYWHETIAPAVRAGQKVVIAAHGNSLRALVKYLDGVSDSDIIELNIPTGIPLVYELDANLKPLRHHYLGDQSAIDAAMHAVANQGKAK